MRSPAIFLFSWGSPLPSWALLVACRCRPQMDTAADLQFWDNEFREAVTLRRSQRLAAAALRALVFCARKRSGNLHLYIERLLGVIDKLHDCLAAVRLAVGDCKRS